jgi:hypothetical protein
MSSLSARVERATSLARRVRDKRIVWRGTALTNFTHEHPSPRLAADLFKGEWASRLPSPLQDTTGTVPLFEDERVSWAMERLGGVNGDSVLELGPLEAGHTYMLHRAGAESVLAVESNQRAFLRCLVVKELYGLDRARFQYGDFLEYLRRTDDHFDVCFASGVLYHLLDPVEFIDLISRRADRLFLWTHYFDPRGTSARFQQRGLESVPSSHGGFAHTLHRRKYGYSLRAAGFCGGSNKTSSWLTRDDLMDALTRFGWTDVEVGFESLDHSNGSSLALVARRARVGA